MRIKKYRIVGETRYGTEKFATFLDKGKAYFDCKQANEGAFFREGWFASDFRVEEYYEDITPSFKQSYF